MSLVMGTPSEERDQLLVAEVKSLLRDGVPVFVLDTLGTACPLFSRSEVPFKAVLSLDEVPSTGVLLVINDGAGYLSLVTSPRVDLNPIGVIATVDVSGIRSL